MIKEKHCGHPQLLVTGLLLASLTLLSSRGGDLTRVAEVGKQSFCSASRFPDAPRESATFPLKQTAIAKQTPVADEEIKLTKDLGVVVKRDDKSAAFWLY